MRRCEGHNFEQNPKAFPRCKSRCKIALDWFSMTKKEILLPAHVVKMLIGDAGLLRRWGRCLEARVAALPPALSASARQPSSCSSSSAQGPVRLYPGVAAE